MSLGSCQFQDYFASYLIKPYKVFISHSGKDKEITEIIADIMEEKMIQPYIAERKSFGFPLINKLRDELNDSDSILVIWTKNACGSSTSQIIGFETGMAWSNHMPVFVLKDSNKDLKIAWFYNQLTDYPVIDIDEINRHGYEEKKRIIKKEIDKLQFNYYHMPICFYFPKSDNHKRNSKNKEVITSNGSIHLKSEFNDILHFIFGNHTNRIVRDIRITMTFPSPITISFDEGDQGLSIKTEIFWMRRISPNVVRLAWPVLPSEEHRSAELRLSVPEIKEEFKGHIHISIQGGEYSRREIDIPITVQSRDTLQ